MGKGRRIRDGSHRLLRSFSMSTSPLRTLVRTVVGALVAALIASTPLPAAHADRVTPELFGMDLIQLPEPAVPLGPTPTARLIVKWAGIETTRGDYDWSALDARIRMAEESGSKPLLTIYATPAFHAVGEYVSPQWSYLRPPSIRAYRAFVRALAKRYGTRVDYQLWAEMNVPGNYLGTREHMAKMVWAGSKAVRAAAPGALVVAPQGPVRLRGNRNWFRKFWGLRVHGKPVGKWVDVATFSGFPLAKHGPEKQIRLTKWVRRITSENGFTGPIWIVEVNYGIRLPRPTVPVSMDRQVANVVKTYVLNASIGTQRVYWHYWSKPNPYLDTAMLTDDNQVAPPGKAFAAIQPWLIGTRAEGCTVKRDDLYSCLFTTKRVERRVVWTVSGKRRSILAPAGATTVSSPDGTVRPMGSAKRVKVGLVPVMVESPRPTD